MKPRVLLLTNENRIGDARGQINGYELLVESGEIQSCNSVSTKEGYDRQSAFDRALEAISNFNYDVVIIWSPGNFPSTEFQFTQLLQRIKGRPILYWEGDPWGTEKQKKPVTRQMAWWMENSEIVFSTASIPHVQTFKEIGAKSVFLIPNTYCHVYFKDAEKYPPMNDGIINDMTMLGSNTARIPGISGSPGSARRWELAIRLHFNSHNNLIYGRGWPKGWSKGYLPYGQQVSEIRKGKLTVNWDNFDTYHNYSSDRLPISLIAGKVHITTLHPGMEWAPGQEIGLFQETSPKKIIERANELLEFDAAVLYKLGFEAHRWAKNRMSHREAARYVLSSFFENIMKPPADPWGKLPGPW